MQQEYSLHPTWWNDQHNSSWERVREALKRDWEQTKADFSPSHGRDLHQRASDTVKQALGMEPLPLTNQPTPHDMGEDWDRVEHAMRYGHGAGVYYGEHRQWDDRLEAELQKEWADLKQKPGWDEVKHHVRRGWDSARNRAQNS